MMANATTINLLVANIVIEHNGLRIGDATASQNFIQI